MSKNEDYGFGFTAESELRPGNQKRDWTGNKNSTFTTLGASNHTEDERAENDFYATDPRTIDELLSVEKFRKTCAIWEPCCGAGHLSKRLEQYGFCVHSTDLVDRGYGISGIDFLKEEFLMGEIIITNPPYKYAQEVVEHAIEIGAEKVAMFLKLTFLEGKARAKLFKKFPPKKVWVYSSRRNVAKNGNEEEFKKSSAACYAWFIWEKGFMGEPSIGWID